MAGSVFSSETDAAIPAHSLDYGEWLKNAEGLDGGNY
jgi:hypothetical protein